MGSLAGGGASIFLLNLGRELKKHGQDVTVFCLEENNPLLGKFVESGIQILVAPEKGTIVEDRITFVLGHLRRLRPGMVVANLGAEGFEVLRYVPKGTKRVGMAHADSPEVYALLGRYAGEVDVICAVSAKIAEKLEERIGAAPPVIVHLPLGIPMGGDQSRRVSPAPAPLRILYLGRVAMEQKRVQLFLPILQRLLAGGVPFHLTIAGKGPDQAWLEERFRECGLSSHVAFLGAVPYDHIRPVLDEHDIFLLPSAYEGLPLSLLDAMGAGLVPVVSDLSSGIREVVDAGNGVLVPPDSADGYADAIASLHNDRNRLGAMSARARVAVREKFSTQAMYERWETMAAQLPGFLAEWREPATILPMRGARHPIRYHPFLRPLRRLVKLSKRKA